MTDDEENPEIVLDSLALETLTWVPMHGHGIAPGPRVVGPGLRRHA